VGLFIIFIEDFSARRGRAINNRFFSLFFWASAACLISVLIFCRKVLGYQSRKVSPRRLVDALSAAIRSHWRCCLFLAQWLAYGVMVLSLLRKDRPNGPRLRPANAHRGSRRTSGLGPPRRLTQWSADFVGVWAKRLSRARARASPYGKEIPVLPLGDRGRF